MNFEQLSDRFLTATNRQLYTLELAAGRKGTSKSDLERHIRMSVDMLTDAQELLPLDWKTKLVRNGDDIYLGGVPRTLVFQRLLEAVGDADFSSNRGIRTAVENRVKYLQGK